MRDVTLFSSMKARKPSLWRRIVSFFCVKAEHDAVTPSLKTGVDFAGYGACPLCSSQAAIYNNVSKKRATIQCLRYSSEPLCGERSTFGLLVGVPVLNYAWCGKCSTFGAVYERHGFKCLRCDGKEFEA